MTSSRTATPIILAMWAVLIGGVFGLGLQPAWGLPACVVCNCKEVEVWYAAVMTAPRGSMSAGTAVPVGTALTGITTSGGCQAGDANKVGTCDIWVFTTNIDICAPAGPALREKSVTDAGKLDTAGANRFKCIVTTD